MVGRFAPTPSGRMHLGNITAMLAAWLSSRSAGESIVLRIEDIDQPRVVPDADRWIMDDLNFLGLNYDGEPIYQSQRIDIYEDMLHRLSEQEAGLVYPCFCSRAQIRAASAPQEGDRFIIYPGTCRHLSEQDREARIAAGERHAYRLALPEPGAREGQLHIDDRVFGAHTFDIGRELGDIVLRRSDGLFAYQFVVSVDDMLMGIDDVVRGRDLLRSAAVQQWLRTRMGDTTAVQYAHIPLLDDAHGVRLAKRVRSLDMGALRAGGTRAEQILGLCAWYLGLQETPAELTAADTLALFDFSRVCRNDVKVLDADLEAAGIRAA